MIDKVAFLTAAGEEFGPLRDSQIDGMSVIIEEANRRKLKDKRWTGYILATSWHETATTMQAVIETRQPREATNPSVNEAIRRLEKAWASGRMSWVKHAYWRKDSAGKSWLGRGLVQTTHKVNYRKLSKLIGVDLVANPERALDLRVSVKMAFVGMLLGVYTGRRLSDYFSATVNDPVNARRIINGVESAQKVAGYYRRFMGCLREPA